MLIFSFNFIFRYIDVLSINNLNFALLMSINIPLKNLSEKTNNRDLLHLSHSLTFTTMINFLPNSMTKGTTLILPL